MVVQEWNRNPVFSREWNVTDKSASKAEVKLRSGLDG